MSRRISVLMYGDCPELQRCDLDLSITRLDADDWKQSGDLDARAFDVVVLNTRAGDDTPVECVRAFQQLAPSCATLMIAEPDALDQVRRGIEAGLTDHLIRCGTADEMAPLLTHALEKIQRQSYLKTRFHESERRFWTFFEHSPLGLVILNLSGKCEHANPAFVDLVGRDVDELRSLRLVDLVDEEDEPIWRPLREELCGKARDFVRLDQKLVHKSGEPRWVSFACAAMRDADGEPAYLLGMARDRTKRKRIQDQLQHADKMQAMGRLAGGVAHDFNNLLTIVSSHCFIMRDAIDNPDKLSWSIERIMTATQRGSKLTRQLLTFGRHQALETEPVDLNELLGKMKVVLDSLFGKTIFVELALGEEVRSVLANRSQFEQIIMNLALNARDAMDDGGRFSVRTYNLDIHTPSSAVPADLPRGKYTVLEVRDTGSGMPTDVQQRAFEPFFTTKEIGQGTGLGLSTVYGVVNQNQGHITVDSEEGRGTTFTIYFPALTQDSATPPKLRRVRQGTPTNGTETILLVEDEDELRLPLKNLLESKGYFVLDAANAEEALEESRNFGGSIDLLLTDVIMPGINGVALADAITGDRPETAVILMSGYTADTLAMNPAAAQERKLIQKPFGMDILSRTIRHMLKTP